ncbi:MAG TPA: hypothetical protein VFE50_17405 [Cyclobacteriaceae bacterium]|nr:hypothetical protein [Cyclobacteriaceae bacterium]
MKMKRYMIVALLSMLIACSEPIEVKPFTYPQVFTGDGVRKAWSIRSVQLLQKGKGTQTFRFDPCTLDDLYVFYNNSERSYQVTMGATKCEDTDPVVIADSNWSFVNATATLTIVMPLLSDSPLPFVLNEIDETKMVLDIYFDDNNSNYRFNFKPAALE